MIIKTFFITATIVLIIDLIRFVCKKIEQKYIEKNIEE